MTLLRRYLVGCIGLCLSAPSVGALELAPPITTEIYLDTAYAWEGAKLVPRAEKNFTTAPNPRLIHPVGYLSHAFQINTAQLSFKTVENLNYRAQFTLQAGTIALASWPSEFMHVQEAFLGFNLLPFYHHPLWMDAGIFLTHIGSESLLPYHNRLSTLSLVSVFEPYFQSGIKLSHAPHEQLMLALYLLNGYGLIQDNNTDKSLGWKLHYQPIAPLEISLTGMAGNEQDQNTPARLRQYHNLNFKYVFSDALELQAQADAAFEELTSYYGGHTTLSYAPFHAFRFSTRLSYFRDPEGIISPGIESLGLTLGAEYKPSPQSYVRLEGRQLLMLPNSSLTFEYANGTSNTRTEFMVSSGIWF